MVDGYEEKLRNLPAVACTNTFNTEFFFIENKTNKKMHFKDFKKLDRKRPSFLYLNSIFFKIFFCRICIEFTDPGGH